jgi:glutamyl/glutaminyl-tRNA synthetase
MELIVSQPASAPLAVLVFYHAQSKTRIKMTAAEIPEPMLKLADSSAIKGEMAIVQHILSVCDLPIYAAPFRAEIDAIVSAFPKYQLKDLDYYLTYRTYLVGWELSLADLAVFVATPEKVPPVFRNVLRWRALVVVNPVVKRFLNTVSSAAKKPPAPQDKKPTAAAPARALKNVVTRFAPEPSGYLHIGHAKAALASEAFARAHGGLWVLRFDDTNPVNESIEFEELIQADVALLDLKPDRIEHSSDFIPQILEIVKQMIVDGLAYVDDTPPDVVQSLRLQAQASPRRDNAVDVNLRLWEEMLAGTETGRQCIARAKIDFQSENGCLRDPTIARCVAVPHVRLPGVTVFPTYDLTCPVVDSRAGISHAMRSWEYTDRDTQYQWFIDKLKLRPVEIISFSRLSFMYTVLGKRHLRKLVLTGAASGWDDPRFPTVRGLRRRGLQPAALRKFSEEQGASANQNRHEWDKLWATNRDYIEKTCPRVMSVSVEEKVVMTVNGAIPGAVEAPILPRDRAQGVRHLTVGPVVWIAQADAALLKLDTLVTLLHWGNVHIDAIAKDGDVVSSVAATWTEDRNFRGTAKLNWIVPESGVHIVMREWNHLLKVKELPKVIPKEKDIPDYVCDVPFADTEIVCDPSIRGAAKGSIWQLERRAEIIVDEPEADGRPALTFLIPSGKVQSIGLPIKITPLSSPSE